MLDKAAIIERAAGYDESDTEDRVEGCEEPGIENGLWNLTSLQ